MLIQKLWGDTELLFKNAITEIYRANINKNKYSSKHYHKNKYNLFYIENGILLVKVWHNTSNYTEHILRAGDRLCVQPEIWHQFLAIEQSAILEIYFTEINNNDIVRSMD